MTLFYAILFFFLLHEAMSGSGKLGKAFSRLTGSSRSHQSQETNAVGSYNSGSDPASHGNNCGATLNGNSIKFRSGPLNQSLRDKASTLPSCPVKTASGDEEPYQVKYYDDTYTAYLCDEPGRVYNGGAQVPNGKMLLLYYSERAEIDLDSFCVTNVNGVPKDFFRNKCSCAAQHVFEYTLSSQSGDKCTMVRYKIHQYNGKNNVFYKQFDCSDKEVQQCQKTCQGNLQDPVYFMMPSSISSSQLQGSRQSRQQIYDSEGRVDQNYFLEYTNDPQANNYCSHGGYLPSANQAIILYYSGQIGGRSTDHFAIGRFCVSNAGSKVSEDFIRIKCSCPGHLVSDFDLLNFSGREECKRIYFKIFWFEGGRDSEKERGPQVRLDSFECSGTNAAKAIVECIEKCR